MQSKRKHKTVAKEFRPPHTIELIPKSDIFPSESGQKGWVEYYRRYPDSGGYWFSAVGFNPARTRAIVDMGQACGILSGKGGA
jgi:hypothetical protein